MKFLSCQCRHLRTLIYTILFLLMIILTISTAFILIGD